MKNQVILLLFLLLLAPDCFALEEGQTISLALGKKVLSIRNSSVDEGGEAVVWTDTNVPAQRWILSDNGHGGFFLQNAYSGYYLGTESTLRINQALMQVRKSSSRASWELYPIEGSDDLFVLFAGTSHRYCLAASSAADGNAVKLSTLDASTAEQNQWKVTVVDEQPTQLTEKLREEMMARWQKQYYHKASTGYVIGKGGWWGDAEMFEVVLDAYETTGYEAYSKMFHELYLNFCSRNGTDWSGNSYNDDIAWMCIACVRAYLLIGKDEYLSRAKTNFDKMYKRANAYGNGTLIWCQGKSGTNSCINGPASVCACYLGIATGNESYFEKAATTYAGERQWLFNLSNNGTFNGQVYDSYSTDNKKVSNTWSSTYNQGTCLGAALMLYQHFGTEQYKTDAQKIASWTRKNLADEHGFIKVCQTVTGDLTGFKGILMRYIRRYAADLDVPEYYDFLAQNAWHAFQNRNSKGISMSAWLSKTPEDFKFSDGGDFSTDGVGAFTAISAAYNAHLGVQNSREAFLPIEAHRFNYLHAAFVAEENGEPVVSKMQTGQYVGYRRISFGDSIATHILVNLCCIRSTALVHVYADSPDNKGILLCTIQNTENPGEWSEQSLPLSTPLSGTHDIYFVCEGTKNIRLASLRSFQFQTQGMADGITSPSVHDIPHSTHSIFDLSGRPVSRPLRGLYIQDGRKVLRK